MSGIKEISRCSIALLLSLGVVVWAQEQDTAEVIAVPEIPAEANETAGTDEAEEVVEEELPLEEALMLIDKYCPLPSFDEEGEPNPTMDLLPLEDEEPDYALLRSLQLEDKIREAESRISGRNFGNSPIILEDYFKVRETMFLRDPERYLTTQERTTLQEVLITHAGESPHNIHLNMLGNSDIDTIYSLDEEQHRKILSSDKSGITVYFFYDDASRVKVFYGDEAKKVIPETIRNELRTSAAHEATLQSDPHQSIYRYLLDFTLQLNQFTDAQKDSSLVESEELAPSDAIEEEEAVAESFMTRVKQMISEIRPSSILTVGAMILLASSLIAYFLWHRDKKRHVFAISDKDPQFGLPRAKGCSGSLEFGKSAPSVREQKKKLFP